MSPLWLSAELSVTLALHIPLYPCVRQHTRMFRECRASGLTHACQRASVLHASSHYATRRDTVQTITVGIVHRFQADNEEHAVEQFLDAIGLGDYEADVAAGEVNYLKIDTEDTLDPALVAASRRRRLTEVTA